MVIEATYAPGSGTLLGLDARWVLVAAELEPRTIDDLWLLLQRPGSVVEDIVTRVEKDFPIELPSLVVADVTPGGVESATRGHGRLRTDGDTRLLTLGVPTDPHRRLIGGVVSASAAAVVVTAPARPTEPVAPAPLIVGVPDHILAAKASGPPVRPTPVPMVEPAAVEPVSIEAAPAPTPEPLEPIETGDHDGHTMMRVLEGDFEQGGQPTDQAAAPSPEHTVFGQDEGETVLAMRCVNGHLTPAFNVSCRVCHQPVPQQEPVRTPRPQLGVLRLPSGELVPVDRGVVFGRRPAPVPGSERWPHLVHLPTESTYLSRMHLQIELDGWLVLARDLGSQGGTRLHVPGREPELIRPHEPYVLEHGWVLDLADVYGVIFEASPDVPQQQGHL